MQGENCAGIYNQSHFRSHKRPSHGKRGKSARASKGEAGNLEAIVSTFEQLPEVKKTEVLHRLAASAQNVLVET